MTKTIQQKVIEKAIMNFVDAASKRAAKVFTEKTEQKLKKHQDKKNARKIDVESSEEDID